jgi:hypothetical protein
MTRMRLSARVDADGVLRLNVPVGADDADQEVQVTIEPARPAMTQEEWRRWVDSMAGKWQGEFERPEQGEYEQRDALP